MDKKTLVTELQKAGIKVENGKIKRSDIKASMEILAKYPSADEFIAEYVENMDEVEKEEYDDYLKKNNLKISETTKQIKLGKKSISFYSYNTITLKKKKDKFIIEMSQLDSKYEVEPNQLLEAVGFFMYMDREPIHSSEEEVKVDEKTYTIAEFQKLKNLKVKGDLGLSYTEITSLPEDLKVGGNLGLSYTEITSLPKDLKVGGDLDLSYTKITSLPKGLEVGGDLDLYGTKITILPEGLKVGREILVDYPDKIKCSDRLKKLLKVQLV